ncbi:MAG: ABC transporter permease [Anaerolineae bacterium]|nr:ABC transporter permease [Anaerolineae bacterium]
MIHSPWHAFRVVFAKELRELLRDRKTLFWLFAPPIILPAIALIAAGFIGTQTARYVSDGFQIAVINAEAAPDLMAVLRHSAALIVHEYPNEAAISDHNALITLSIPDDFQEKIESGTPVSVKLIQRDNSVGATLALGAVRSEINTYNGLELDQRLKRLNLDKRWLSPVLIEEQQIAAAATSVTTTDSGSNSAAGGLSGLFLPLAVTSWLVGGGLGLIVDTTVGEKERQTIESILVTPANRVGIVLGKLAVVFIASLLVMGLWMVEGMVLSLLGSVGPQIVTAMQGGSVDISALLAQSGRDVGTLALLLLILLLPFIVVLNSLVMAFCSFASSYRESNTFLFLLQLMLPALVLLSVFSISPDAGIGWYAAPLLGTIIAVRDLFGNSLTTSALMLAVISASIYAIAAIMVASYVYSHEWALARR